MTARKSARHPHPVPPPARGTLRRPPTASEPSWNDALIALAAMALTMAALVLIAALAGENVAGGEAGKFWAFLFAAGLGLSGVFLLLMGLVLLAERARLWSRHVFPAATGVASGAIVGALTLDGAGSGAILAPLLILALALPPAREALQRVFRRGGERPR